MDLNTALIILGILALVALIAHGLWSSRREKTHFFKNANTFTRDGRIEQPKPNPENKSADPLTDMPIQQAEQLHGQQQPLTAQTFLHEEQPLQPGLDFDSPIEEPNQANYSEPLTDTVTPDLSEEQAISEIKITLPGQNVTEKTAEPIYYDMPSHSTRNNAVATPSNAQTAQYSTPNYEYPSSSSVAKPASDLVHRSIADMEANLDQNEGISLSSELREQFAYGSQHKTTYSQPNNVQASTANSSLEPVASTSATAEVKSDQTTTTATTTATTQKDFIVLYVVAPENREFNGSYLLQALEELGFVYSDEGIFNRHLDTLASPVLYSVANIHQPGTFDLQTMADFSTIGVAIFMQLSATARDRVNFIYLCQDAKNLADKLSGYVLDENQELFNEQTKSAYLASLSQ